MAFVIEFSPDARDHLKAMRKRDQQIIVDAIAVQLTHQPDQPTTHRKPLEDNPVIRSRLGNCASATTVYSTISTSTIRRS